LNLVSRLNRNRQTRPDWYQMMGGCMAASDRDDENAHRERAYYIWKRDGRPEGQVDDHWRQAERDEGGEPVNRDDAIMEDEEKILAGRSGANMPALLTKDVPGG
jgi:Protein of unknown function (DUF2934)